PGEPARGHRPPPVRGLLLQGDRQAARRHGDRGEGPCASRLRASADVARLGEGARVNDCDRFLEALASDQLDDAARVHARGCASCRPLLPEESPDDGATPASLEPVRARALEALRTTPLRPWKRDAARIALLQGVVALVVTVMLGDKNWSSPMAHHF